MLGNGRKEEDYASGKGVSEERGGALSPGLKGGLQRRPRTLLKVRHCDRHGVKRVRRTAIDEENTTDSSSLNRSVGALKNTFKSSDKEC